MRIILHQFFPHFSMVLLWLHSSSWMTVSPVVESFCPHRTTFHATCPGQKKSFSTFSSLFSPVKKPSVPLNDAIGPFFEEEEITEVSTTVWEGAGSPRPELLPEDIPSLLMSALRFNDLPYENAGLCTVWEFASENTRHIFNNNLTEFIESAKDTAKNWPTSFYGAAMNNGTSWNMETSINRVGGTDGWIATQVMKTTCRDGRMRRWQWELRKNRRPPNLGSWYVETIGSSDRKGNFVPEN